MYKKVVSPRPNLHLVVFFIQTSSNELYTTKHLLPTPPNNTIKMSFHLSAEDARIESRDGHTYLLARLRREDGEWNDAEFDLDTVLGNNDGK